MKCNTAPAAILISFYSFYPFVSRQQFRFAVDRITVTNESGVNIENIRFDLFMNTAPATIVVQPDAPVFTIITANDAFLEATKTTLADLTGIGFLQAFPENPTHNESNGVHILRDSLLKALATRQRTVMDGHRYDIRAGKTGAWETRYWMNTNSPIINESGEVECIVHTTNDITAAYHSAKKEKNAFDVAEAQRRQLHDAYKQAPVGIGLLSGRELKIEFGNEGILNVLGKTNDIVGKTVAEAIPELYGQPFLAILDRVYNLGKTYYGNNMPASFEQNGTLREGFYNFIYHPLKNADGKTTGIMVIGIDVTEQVIARKELEHTIEQKNIIADALRNNEARLQGILDTLAEGVSITDIYGNVIYTNAAAQRMVGYSEEDMGERSYNDEKWKNLRLDGSPLPEEEHPMTVALTKQQPVIDYEYSLLFPDKKRVYFSLNTAPLYDAGNNLTGAIGTFTNVTKRRKLIEQLAESESRFRGIFEQAPLGMCMLRGREQIIEAVNDNILKIWGRTREEVIGLPQQIARPELQGQSIFEWLDEVFVTGRTRTNIDLKVNLNNPLGGTREAIVNSVYQPITDVNGNVIGVLMITDEITEQYAERLRTAHTQEMFNLAVASAALGTWYYDIDTAEFVPSARAKELYGYYTDEAMPYEAAFLQVTDEYRNSVKKIIMTAYRRGDGYDFEYPVTGYHDNQIRWVRSTGKMYASQDGKGGQFSGTILDVTERKMDEIRKNDFIAMVSHELMTPLTSMKTSLQILQILHTAPEADVNDMLLKANRQINKMTNLINSFLNVSRLDAGKIYLEKKNFDIDKLIKEIIDDMSFTTKEHLITFLPCDSVTVFADPEKTGQVINNFISNAVKYSPRGTHIDITCIKTGNDVQVSVKDEGKGVSAHDKERLFDRFYRVENKDNTTISGFGIGLYVCAEIIRRHNGRIRVESEEGKGSTFSFMIPGETGEKM